MTALPSAAEAQKLLPNDNPTAQHLYDTVILPAEKAASEATDDGAAFRTVLARVVGYLLLYPPSDQARAIVQREIEACKDERDINEALYALGGMYVKDLILPFFSILEEMTPQLTGVGSRDSYEHMKERARQGQLDMPRDTAEAKDFALARDDFRCQVSRVADYHAIQGGIIDGARDLELPRPARRSWCTSADCCHIFPEALEVHTREDVDCKPNIVTKNHAEAFWDILGRFGYEHIHNELKGAKIHHLKNIMTLAAGIHSLFRSFDIWFDGEQDSEGDGQENCYCVGASLRLLYEHFDPPIPEGVQFIAHADNFLLPNPAYLHVHAACSRVACLSGAWRHLDPLYWEELRRIELEGRAPVDGDANGPLLPEFP